MATVTVAMSPLAIPETTSLIVEDDEGTSVTLGGRMDVGGGSSTDSRRAPKTPELAMSELILGKRLGSGGFSVVHEILDIDLRHKSSDSMEKRQIREELADHCHDRDSTPHEPNYVVKMLRRDLPQDEQTKGIADLAIEARFLECLRHPNIITMKATSDRDPLDASARYFIVLEKLHCTLEKQLTSWRREVGSSRGCVFGCCRHSMRLHDLWVERLNVARDIASAVHYLHALRITFRDLKPENVGFDELGVVKLFDFGLAKSLPLQRNQSDGLFRLTGNTGSLRYMAPEVALCLPYDERVDSYSFGILFWQICALAVPYAGFSCKMHADLVVKQGHRPKINKTWPANWGQLMRECWSGDIYVRPDFERILSVLGDELRDLEDTDASHIKGRKRRFIPVSKSGRALDVDMRFVQRKAENVVESAADEEQNEFDTKVV